MTDEKVIVRLYSSILFGSKSDSYQTPRFRNIWSMNKSYKDCIQVFYSIQSQIPTKLEDSEIWVG
jgi:hypothetical protein